MAPDDNNYQQRSEFLVFGAPEIGDAEIDDVVDSLRSGWLGAGPKVARFEVAFGDYKGAPNCVAVASCTAALHLSLRALDLSPGDEVITTPLTFCATVNAIIHAGATPILADVDPLTMNIDPAAVAASVTPRTRAIVPVHFAGRPCDMESLRAIADKHNLSIVEDCAHAIETEYRGEAAGTMGEFGCFSFYPTKNVTTGEGGMIVARRAEDATRIQRMALHGLSHDAWRRFRDKGYKHYLVTELGFKCNMTDLQAAIGLHQLARIEANWERRRAIWERYSAELVNMPIALPEPPEANTRHAFHLFTVLVETRRTGMTRDDFLNAIHAENIGAGVHYLSLAEQPYYQDCFGWRPDAWPNARDVGRATVSLPLTPALSDDDVGDVIAATRHVLRK